MKRVLLSLVLVPLAGALGLAAFHWFSDRGFAADHPRPGQLYGKAGSKLHAIEKLGAEPAVVFVHGNPGTCLDFMPVLDRLSPQHRVLAFDRPGYGWSERPAADLSPTEQARLLHAAVVELGLRKPVLAGFSFGGPVVLAYALEYPNEVSALVLIAAVGSPTEGHHMGSGQAMLAAPWTGSALAYLVGPLMAPDAVSAGYVDAFFPASPDPDVVQRGRLHFSRPMSLLASARDWKVLETELPKLAARYGELKLPIEGLSARDDRIVGPQHANYLVDHLPTLNVELVDHAGHQLMSTHPEVVTAAVQRALARAAR